MRSLLRKVGRREVDGDPLSRKRQPDRGERGADPLTAFRDRLVRQADNDEGGKSGAKLHLNLDRAGLEAQIRDGSKSNNPLARPNPASLSAGAIASALRDACSMATSRPMISRRNLRRFFDKAWVEWGMFALGVLLIVAGIIIAPIPGPGGVFLIAPGVALILRTSMWAKRHYVKMKRWQPKAGRYTDLALRRKSARRREAIRKAERRQQRLLNQDRGD